MITNVVTTFPVYHWSICLICTDSNRYCGIYSREAFIIWCFNNQRPLFEHRAPLHNWMHGSVHKHSGNHCFLSCAILYQSSSIPSALTSITARSLQHLFGPCLGVLVKQLLRKSTAMYSCQPPKAMFLKNICHVLSHSKPVS